MLIPESIKPGTILAYYFNARKANLNAKLKQLLINARKQENMLI